MRKLEEDRSNLNYRTGVAVSQEAECGGDFFFVMEDKLSELKVVVKN